MKQRNEKIKTLEENLNAIETKLNESLLDNNNKTNLIDYKLNKFENSFNHNHDNDANGINNKENLIKLSTSTQQQQHNDSISHTNDYIVLKDECSQLKIRIQAIEDEMKKFLKLFFCF